MSVTPALELGSIRRRVGDEHRPPSLVARSGIRAAYARSTLTTGVRWQPGVPRGRGRSPRALSEALFLAGRHWRDRGVRGGAARGPSPGNPSPFFFAEIKQSQETIMSTEVPRCGIRCDADTDSGARRTAFR